jgi:hypothetical protein
MALHSDAVCAGLTRRLRLVVADCGVGLPESVTVTFTDDVPTEFCAGVPVMAPDELLMTRPVGRPVALYL